MNVHEKFDWFCLFMFTFAVTLPLWAIQEHERAVKMKHFSSVEELALERRREGDGFVTTAYDGFVGGSLGSLLDNINGAMK